MCLGLQALVHLSFVFGHLLENLVFSLATPTPLCFRATLTTPTFPLGLTIIAPCLLRYNPQAIRKWARDNVTQNPLRTDLRPLIMVHTLTGLEREREGEGGRERGEGVR